MQELWSIYSVTQAQENTSSEWLAAMLVAWFQSMSMFGEIYFVEFI